jgi:hypothetical protein
MAIAENKKAALFPGRRIFNAGQSPSRPASARQTCSINITKASAHSCVNCNDVILPPAKSVKGILALPPDTR